MDTTSRAGSLATGLVAPATMVVVLAVSLLLLMTPIWTHFALLMAWASGTDTTYALALSDSTIAELFFGPGTFSAFAADEAGHMRDVRVVFWAFMAVALASAVLIGWRVARHGRDARTWRAISVGGLALIVGLVVVGTFALVAFDVAFELFHRIFFPGGNFAFPANSLLIRLYPYAFWQLSAAALGLLSALGGGIAWYVGRRKARQLEAAPA